MSAWRERYTSVLDAVAFRATSAFDAMPGAILSWIQFGKLNAAELHTADWNRDAFRQSLDEIRSLTRVKLPEIFVRRLRDICAKNGVAVVVAPTPRGCHASGATCFLSDKKAMILLSFRHRSDDQFWFTFFHEAGHLVLHDRSALFIEDGSEITSNEEDEANEFATKILLPDEKRIALHNLAPDKEAIQRFAVQAGIARGIVVGQLQHIGRLEHDKLNWMKRRYSKEEIVAAAEMAQPRK